MDLNVGVVTVAEMFPGRFIYQIRCPHHSYGTLWTSQSPSPSLAVLRDEFRRVRQDCPCFDGLRERYGLPADGEGG